MHGPRLFDVYDTDDNKLFSVRGSDPFTVVGEIVRQHDGSIAPDSFYVKER